MISKKKIQMKNKFKEIIYFVSSEFDSPDLKNSGELMNLEFLKMLDSARHLADTPFIINSGYRTAEHNKKVGGIKSSSHLKGLAVDIKIINSIQRFKILNALLSVGFVRVGIGSNFLHVDFDLTKGQNIIWLY